VPSICRDSCYRHQTRDTAIVLPSTSNLQNGAHLFVGHEMGALTFMEPLARWTTIIYYSIFQQVWPLADIYWSKSHCFWELFDWLICVFRPNRDIRSSEGNLQVIKTSWSSIYITLRYCLLKHHQIADVSCSCFSDITPRESWTYSSNSNNFPLFWFFFFNLKNLYIWIFSAISFEAFWPYSLIL
jgi:hypothetical protein